MACAGTLKRHLEFDSLNPQKSPKRMCLGHPSTPTSLQPRGFRASPEWMAPSFRRHKNHLSPISSSASKMLGDSSRRSFMDSIIKKNSRLNLNDLLTSLTTHKKDQNTEDTRADAINPPKTNHIDASPDNKNDVPSISMKMMDYIRSRMLEEFEADAKEYFDRVLADKLTEQYESFLSFNHHQLTNKFHASCASYVS